MPAPSGTSAPDSSFDVAAAAQEPMGDVARRYTPKHRINAKPHEKKKDALIRLSRKRQEAEKMLKAKREVFFQTGDEYFFKIYSTYVKNRRVYRDSRPEPGALRRALLYVNTEIKRSERKLLAYVPEPKGTHIRYCDDSAAGDVANAAKNEVIDCEKSSGAPARP
ncbi:UNVERIFIED_CONTAM: hypothetical protein PYX00_011460 [Menopon gallinae]|uniref:Uncharacterized protein n=1 Tax=Menopon gallinae TaxID=328185 RepID=A0AAW2H7K2_9NEOP